MFCLLCTTSALHDDRCLGCRLQRAIDITKSDKDFSAEQRTAAKEVARASHLNSAACHLKLNQPKDVLSSANEV